VAAYNILNRNQLEPRMNHHKLQIPAPPESEEKLVTSVRELWEDERRRRLAKGLDPTPPASILEPRQPEYDVHSLIQSRYWASIEARIESEKDADPPVRAKAWESWVMTTFESIQALWSRPYKTWRPSSAEGHLDDLSNPFNSSGSSAENTAANAEIDEKLLSSQDIQEEIHKLESSEDEWQRWHDARENPEENELEYVIMLVTINY
jgi:DNA polymerase zeta